ALGKFSIRIDHPSRESNYRHNPVQILDSCLERTGPDGLLIVKNVLEKGAWQGCGRMLVVRGRAPLGICRCLLLRLRDTFAAALFGLQANGPRQAEQQDKRYHAVACS